MKNNQIYNGSLVTVTVTLNFCSFCSEEAKALKNKGVNIIIALGHSGYEEDMNIAKNCPLIDVVIGGHTHSFLYSDQQPDIEKIDGPYPTVIKQSSGKQVPVVQAYAYTKYLGELELSVSFKNSKIVKEICSQMGVLCLFVIRKMLSPSKDILAMRF